MTWPPKTPLAFAGCQRVYGTNSENPGVRSCVSSAAHTILATTHLASEEICIQILNVKRYIYRYSYLFLWSSLLLRSFRRLDWLILRCRLATLTLSGQVPRTSTVGTLFGPSRWASGCSHGTPRWDSRQWVRG
jgi:hypothetical protein